MIPNSVLIESYQLAAWNPKDYIVLETDSSPEAFIAGHITGSVFWPMTDLFTPEFRLRTEPDHFAMLMSRSRIIPEKTVVCAHNGDPKMAGWSTWLFWILTSFGHAQTMVLNGGTPKWREEGRPLESGAAQHQPSTYPAPSKFDESQRATLADLKSAEAAMILDVRSTQEYRGEHYFDAPPQNGERAGHIPDAVHIPIDRFIRPNGTFRSTEELRDLNPNLERKFLLTAR